MEDGILAGVRVLDLAEGLAGSVAAMILAEAGAEVVKVEPPGGARLRGRPPFSVWNRSKQSVVVDLAGGERAVLEDLARSADVLIHDLAPAAAAALGLDAARLTAVAPSLIACAVTGFPAGHDEEETTTLDTLVLAAAGIMDEQAPVRRQDGPVYLRFPLGSWGAAWLAAIGVATRLFNVRRGGAPGSVGTSLLQGALVPMLMHWRRLEAPSAALIAGMSKQTNATIAQCADGVWLHTMSDPEIAPAMQAELARMTDAERQAANRTRTHGSWPNWGACFVAFKARPSADWLAALWACDVAVQPALPMGALYYDEQCQTNGYVVDVEDPDLGHTRQPGAPYTVTPPARVRSPAPRLDADRDAVLAGWRTRPPAAAATRRFERPLEGIKVLDLGAYLAGPLAPMLMGDLGAEVIKFETTGGDAMRGAEFAFFGCQRNKRSIAADMKNPAVRPIIERLVRDADVVHHNLRMPAATRLGIDYQSLKAINPRLVYCHVSAYGPIGPRKDWPGFDQLFQSSSGWEYEGAGAGNPPMWHRFGMMDHQAAMASLFATMLALIERERTGAGQFVAASLLGASLLTTSETLVLPDGELAPYPKLDADQLGVGPGDRLYPVADGWIALVADAAALARLADSLGAVAPADIEARLAQLTQKQALTTAAEAGAQAAPVRLGQRDAFFDNAANRRSRVAASTVHPVYGRSEQPSALWAFEGQALAFERAAPLIGQHTEEILGELGFGPAEIDALKEAAAIVQAR